MTFRGFCLSGVTKQFFDGFVKIEKLGLLFRKIERSWSSKAKRRFLWRPRFLKTFQFSAQQNLVPRASAATWCKLGEMCRAASIGVDMPRFRIILASSCKLAPATRTFYRSEKHFRKFPHAIIELYWGIYWWWNFGYKTQNNENNFTKNEKISFFVWPFLYLIIRNSVDRRGISLCSKRRNSEQPETRHFKFLFSSSNDSLSTFSLSARQSGRRKIMTHRIAWKLLLNLGQFRC